MTKSFEPHQLAFCCYQSPFNPMRMKSGENKWRRLSLRIQTRRTYWNCSRELRESLKSLEKLSQISASSVVFKAFPWCPHFKQGVRIVPNLNSILNSTTCPILAKSQLKMAETFFTNHTTQRMQGLACLFPKTTIAHTRAYMETECIYTKRKTVFKGR